MEKYTLIITEKPDAAQRIASALDEEEKPRKMEENGVPYYVAQCDKRIVIVPAVGHLYTVAAENKERNLYPIFDFKWVPRHIAERGAKQIRTWIETITKLAENADVFIDACDYDIEGSLIGYCILKYACNNKEQTSKRMKYSTLTKPELEKSYSQPLPHLDFPLVEAGRTRHEVDWLYGINLSRALTNAAKTFSGKYTTLSAGRVQGPTLKFVAAREKSIRTFVPTPYWEVRAKININGTIFEAEYEKKTIETRKEAETILTACKGRNGQAEKIEIKQFQQPPPLPFDLGALQNEAYSLFRYTPRRTANTAQRLYLDASISYPRTSSQKLPPAINYKTILKNLNKSFRYAKLTAELLTKPELKPAEGKKEDPAHPAIYPTGNIPERVLEGSERNIWDLVIRRFMAVFSEPATRQSIKITFNVNEHHFYVKGRHITKEGWLHFYEPYVRMQEVLLPKISEGQTVKIKEVFVEDKFTKPPPRYNPGSLLRRMEEREIGTKATRADIIQTLYERKYVQDERMTVTDLGFEVLKVLENYCPTIISIMMTKELEEKMNKIQEQKESREDVLTNAVEMLKPAAEKLRENEKTIGEQLSNAIRESKLQERIIGTCPICKTGKLMAFYSRRTGKRFVGCSNYFKGLCKTSFPLPQKGYIKALDKNCPGCHWPRVQVRMRGRPPWVLCFNPKCLLKEKRRQRIEMRNMQ
jgi:DNA topoisomerase-1